jgi:cytoskeletal protein CcmA (bactofilin family)
VTDVQNDVLEDEDFDTILSRDIDFEGTLNFEKSLLVRGKLKGAVCAEGVFLVDTEAEVEADLTADEVVIRGAVTGNVLAYRRVEVTASGWLIGNVKAPKIQMEAGCTFNGQCIMGSVTRESGGSVSKPL